uniref:DUF4939 domain-containing protein n=1 Tax=Fundulus heteroclitus TaxID=8078 RepID=A0A3Q2PGX9_FUNHE
MGLQGQLQGLASQLNQLASRASANQQPATSASLSPSPEPTSATTSPPISFILRLLTGRALRWAESRFPDCQQFGCTFSEFISEFKTVFAAESDEANGYLPYVSGADE